MTRDRDDVGHREPGDDRRDPGRRREGPVDSGQGIVVILDPTSGVPDPPTASATMRDGTGLSGPGGRAPTAQTVGDVGLVGLGPVAHRGRDHQVAEPAVERHGGHHRDAGFASAVAIVGEGVQVRLDLSGDVDVRDPGAERGTDHGTGRDRERPRTVDDRPRSHQRAVERLRICDVGGAHLELRVRRREIRQLRRIAPRKDRNVPAIDQLRHDEPTGVPVRAVHRHAGHRCHEAQA